MVKAPRSKGCRVCVERRIACDMTKPFCRKCQKSRRLCPGYQTYIIVDETASLTQRYNLVETSPSPDEVEIGGRNPYQDSQPQSQVAPYEVTYKNAMPSFERSALVALLTPSTVQAQALSQFISSLGSHTRVDPLLSSLNHRRWLAQIANRTDISPCLTAAVRALSIAHVGGQMRDPALIKGAQKLYGSALRLLNKAIQDPVEGYSADTLSATVLLSFYEILSCTDHDSWVRHAGGAGKLIRLRGPERHREGFGRAVLLSCRWSILMQALQTKKACFLADEPWQSLFKDIAKDMENENKSTAAFYRVKEALFLELAHIPGYLAEAVDFMASGLKDRNKLAELAHRGQDHRSRYKKLQRNITRVLKKEGLRPRKVVSISDDRLFDVVYEFPGFSSAFFYSAYWPIMSVLNLILLGLEGRYARLSAIYEPGPQMAISASADAARGCADQDVCVLEHGQNRLLESGPVQTSSLAFRIHRSSSRSVIDDSDDDDSEAEEFPTLSASDIKARQQIYTSETVHMARETCRSYEHISQSSFPGPIHMVNSLRVAMRVLRGEEQAWALRQCEKLGETFGLASTEAERFKRYLLEDEKRRQIFGKDRDWSPWRRERIWDHYTYVWTEKRE